VPIFLPYFALALLFFKRVIPGLLILTASALISPTAVSGHEAVRLAEVYWNTILHWSEEHLLTVIPLAVLTAILLVAEIGLGPRVFARTVGIITSLVLIPYVMELYPFPHSNNFYGQELRRPWLPAENITLVSHQVVIGYTLSSDSDWLVVLLADNRQIVYYRVDDVATRQVCQIGPVGPMRPLIALSPRTATVPLCIQSTTSTQTGG
jgi:hypothetical protein